MKRIFLTAFAAAVLAATAGADDGRLLVSLSGTNTFLQVWGDKDDEWRFEASADLVAWSNAPALGAVHAGKSAAPPVGAGSPAGDRRFFRAVRTDGLFDVAVLRTLNLTFQKTNWLSLLKANYAKGSNLLANLEMNGTTNTGVGVRYRGNTSYTTTGTKKSLNIEINYTNDSARLMGYRTINLINANGDESIMREPLYFNIMRAYTVCPRASFVRLTINGEYWGLYSFVEQENADLVKEWFPSNDGDRWRAPNMGGATAGGGGGPGGGGGGGGFSGGGSALTYLGTNLATYKSNYEIKTQNSTNAWEILRHATEVLNTTDTNALRDKVEDVLAVDRWLWFLAIENIFTDEDSYYYKGADYEFYHEPESGRLHPIEHDGNESSVSADVSLSPVQGTGNANRPVISRLLAIPELRQRYLAHMRTALEESVNPAVLAPVIEQYRALTLDAILKDTKKNYTMATYTNDVAALKTFIQKRHTFLTNHAELRALPPTIVAVSSPTPAPGPREGGAILAEVQPRGTEGLDSVWLYYRPKPYGRFNAVRMLDDGAHGDGLANDGVFGGTTTNYPAGTKVRYYVEARSANSAKAASFAPARAEQVTFSYRVGLTTAANSPVALNEIMASNDQTVADPQGDYDDWIELRNLTDREVDLSGRYLSNDPAHPRLWPFPSGTVIPADGYLLVWADEDTQAGPGLHANFKLPASGGQLLLIDTDAKDNAVLDAVAFEAQSTDRSYGRARGNADAWESMDPTPGAANQ